MYLLIEEEKNYDCVVVSSEFEIKWLNTVTVFICYLYSFTIQHVSL